MSREWATAERVKVWDPLVRIFQWTLVVSFTVAYFTAEEESAWHIYSGYTVTGLMVYAIEENAGPLAAFAVSTDAVMPIASARADESDDEEAREEFWEELHELFTNFALVLNALHIIGAIAASLAHRENLIQAMVTGYKQRRPGERWPIVAAKRSRTSSAVSG